LDHKCPKICTVHNFPQHDYLMTYGRVLGAWMLWRHIKALRGMTRCIGVSSAVVRNLQLKFGLKNSVAIPNGVDRDHFYPVSDDVKQRIRSDLGLPSRAIIWIS